MNFDLTTHSEIIKFKITWIFVYVYIKMYIFFFFLNTWAEDPSGGGVSHIKSQCKKS